MHHNLTRFSFLSGFSTQIITIRKESLNVCSQLESISDDFFAWLWKPSKSARAKVDDRKSERFVVKSRHRRGAKTGC